MIVLVIQVELEVSKVFQGFSEGKGRSTPLPAQFFSELLPEIDHLGELKVLPCMPFGGSNRMEGNFRYLQRQDFLPRTAFYAGFIGAIPAKRDAVLDDALERLVVRGVFLTGLGHP